MELTHLTVREYTSKLASGDPTPGGGSAAALAGVLAAALGEMAGNFTVGKEKFAAVEDDVREILDRLGEQRARLIELTDEDANAYALVGAAYQMPKASDEEKAARQAAIQGALRQAAGVPLAATEACAAIIDELDELRQKGNPNLLSDVAVAAEFAMAALRCGALNVHVNLAYIKDEGYCADVSEIVDARLQAAEQPARYVFDTIESSIRGGV